MGGQLRGSSQVLPERRCLRPDRLWPPPPVTATPCGSARWFPVGLLLSGVQAGTHGGREATATRTPAATRRPSGLGMKAAGCQRAAEMECTGL